MEERTLRDTQCKSVYTLNTWTDDKMKEAMDLLEQGFYVSFCSTCIGHTMAEIVENDGIKRIQAIYGERVEVVWRDGWGERYCHLLTHTDKPRKVRL